MDSKSKQFAKDIARLITKYDGELTAAEIIGALESVKLITMIAILEKNKDEDQT